MSTIELKGRLICGHDQDVLIVRRHLPRHIELTRAEPGCLHFDVQQSDEPLVWTVFEEFASQAAFDMHKARVRASDWGRATAGIKRDYVISYERGQRVTEEVVPERVPASSS